MHSAPDPPDRVSRQRALNESWPLIDAGGKRHARGIPEQPHPIDVTVRLVLDRDGERWVDARADRWHGQHVHVTIEGPRILIYGFGVWVDARDVRRR